MTAPPNVPLFELVGPPCEVPECRGVLLEGCEQRTGDFVLRCTVCKVEARRMSAVEKAAWVVRTIEDALAEVEHPRCRWGVDEPEKDLLH